MLSSNLYDLPEWIRWLLNKQTAVSQIFFSGKEIKICTEGEELFTWCGKVVEECPFRHWKLLIRDICFKYMKDPRTTENKQWLTTPFLHLCCISPSSTQHRIADFMGTLPLPVLCEGALLARGHIMQLLQMFGQLAPEFLPKAETYYTRNSRTRTVH